MDRQDETNVRLLSSETLLIRKGAKELTAQYEGDPAPAYFLTIKDGGGVKQIEITKEMYCKLVNNPNPVAPAHL